MIQPRYFLLLIFLGITVAAHAQSTDEFNLDKVYSIDQGGTIHLQSDDAEVRIIGSDRQDVHLKVHYKLTVKGLEFGTADKFKMVVEERNGNLHISERPREFQNHVLVGYTKEEYTILVEAPRGAALQMEGDDETFEISGIDGKIHIDADDTKIALRDCKGDDFNFKMDDGKITMDSGRGKLRAVMDDGDLSVASANFSSVDVKADDGDVILTTSLADDGRYRFDLDDGDLTFTVSDGGGTFDIRHDNARISASSNFERVMDEEYESRYRLPGGNAEVQVRSDDGEISLKVF